MVIRKWLADDRWKMGKIATATPRTNNATWQPRDSLFPTSQLPSTPHSWPNRVASFSFASVPGIKGLMNEPLSHCAPCFGQLAGWLLTNVDVRGRSAIATSTLPARPSTLQSSGLSQMKCIRCFVIHSNRLGAECLARRAGHRVQANQSDLTNPAPQSRSAAWRPCLASRNGASKRPADRHSAWMETFGLAHIHSQEQRACRMGDAGMSPGFYHYSSCPTLSASFQNPRDASFAVRRRENKTS